jgi:hypothetical protein
MLGCLYVWCLAYVSIVPSVSANFTAKVMLYNMQHAIRLHSLNADLDARCMYMSRASLHHVQTSSSCCTLMAIMHSLYTLTGLSRAPSVTHRKGMVRKMLDSRESAFRIQLCRSVSRSFRLAHIKFLHCRCCYLGGKTPERQAFDPHKNACCVKSFHACCVCDLYVTAVTCALKASCHCGQTPGDFDANHCVAG